MGEFRWPDHWSHTTLDLYACPAALFAKLSGEAAVRPQNVYGGSDLHEAIARLAQAAWERGTTKHAEAAAEIALGYDEPVRSNFLAFAKSARFPWPLVRAGRTGTCPVEQMWECELPGGEQFIGRIDLAFVDHGANKDNPFADSEDSVKLIDWKQGRPKTWWADEAPKQLVRYAYMYGQNHPEAQEYDVFYGAPNWNGAWSFRKWHLSAHDLSNVGNELAALIKRIRQTERWEPRPSEDHCGRCFYALSCPLRHSSFLELEGLEPETHAELAAGYKAIAAAHEALVYAHVEATGRDVMVSAEKAYRYNTPRPGYEVVNYGLLTQTLADADELLKGSRTRNSAVARALTVDQDNLRPMVETLLSIPEFEARIAAAVREKPAGKPRISLQNTRPPSDDVDEDADDNADEPAA